MKKILLSLAVIAIVAIGAIGATRAYFSDTAAISGNTFTAGTMNLKIDADPSSSVYQWEDGFAAPADMFTNLYPGYTSQQIIDIMSVGTVGGVATFDMNRTSAWSDLAGVLNFHVYYDAEHDGSFIDTGLNGTVDAFNGPYNLGAIASADKMASIKIVWTIPTSAGNEIQADGVTFDATFGLDQVK